MSTLKVRFRLRATSMNTAAARVGLAAFMFFLVKGLLWLAVPAVLLVRACTAAPEGAAP